jgi:hypothetical protein
LQYEERRYRGFKLSRVLNVTYSKQQLEIAETGEWKVNLLQGEVGAGCEEDGDAL